MFEGLFFDSAISWSGDFNCRSIKYILLHGRINSPLHVPNSGAAILIAEIAIHSTWANQFAPPCTKLWSGDFNRRSIKCLVFGRINSPLQFFWHVVFWYYGVSVKRC